MVRPVHFKRRQHKIRSYCISSDRIFSVTEITKNTLWVAHPGAKSVICNWLVFEVPYSSSTTVVRKCYSSYQASSLNGCESTTASGVSTASCYCQSNLCNGGGVSDVSALLSTYTNHSVWHWLLHFILLRFHGITVLILLIHESWPTFSPYLCNRV